jgi:hypothetical protein
MGLILFIIVVLVVLALVLWAVSMLPWPPAPPHIREIIMALIVILAALIIASHAGLLAM